MNFTKFIAETTGEFIQTLAVSFGIFLILYLFVMQNYRVEGPSMEPTFFTGENLIIEKVSYYFREPKAGDIVVFHAPLNKDYDYIKRVIATSGEKVKLLNGHFYVNGQLLDESAYLNSAVTTPQEQYLTEGREITVPPNAYFVAGDNRKNSSDSRDFGPVPKANIVGRAFFRYWPVQAIGLISHAHREAALQNPVTVFPLNQ